MSNEQQKEMQVDNSVDSDGTEHYRPALDLTQCHRTFTRGDVTVWLTWLRRGGQWEACMVLTPKRLMAISHERVTPCVIPMSRAWVWAEETGDFGDCLINAGVFCANLGFNPFNPKNPLKVIGIVRDHLGDLLTIPPRPADHRLSVTAEMIVTDNATGKVKEMEVSDEPT
ncbi:hypothetical protein [Pararhodobacter sp.]|uniref:hypothetical protein n=1 Tax=Pararhodobacter sp. TaxID=2127056 RepID=UPI002FDD36D2